MRKILLMIVVFFSILSVSLSVSISASDLKQELVVMTHDSFNVSKAVISEFENNNSVKVRFLKAGDAGAALNQAILSKSNPMADVFFGVDNTFISRAIDANMFISYNSPMLKNIPSALKLDNKNRLVPVDFGDICLNYDKKWFAKRKLAPPQSLEDLLKYEYRGLTVVENPAISSPGLGFLLATVDYFGENGYLDYWKKLKASDVLIVNGWKQAYWGNFTAASDGDRPIVVSYASSPPAEVYYSKEKLKDAPTDTIIGNGSTFRQIEFAGILKGTKNKVLSEKFIDFLLGKTFQEDIPLQMFMFPANVNAKLPKVFKDYAKISDYTTRLTPRKIAKNRDRWIEKWTETVLR